MKTWGVYLHPSNQAGLWLQNWSPCWQQLKSQTRRFGLQLLLPLWALKVSLTHAQFRSQPNIWGVFIHRLYCSPLPGFSLSISSCFVNPKLFRSRVQLSLWVLAISFGHCAEQHPQRKSHTTGCHPISIPYFTSQILSSFGLLWLLALQWLQTIIFFFSCWELILFFSAADWIRKVTSPSLELELLPPQNLRMKNSKIREDKYSSIQTYKKQYEETVFKVLDWILDYFLYMLNIYWILKLNIVFH